MQLFIFCMIHGLVVGVIFTVHRAARYVMPKGWCVIGDLIMLFMDTYILALLPLLAIERLVILKEPYHSVRQRRKWSIIATVTIIFVTMMLAWIPIIPQLGIPQQVVVKTSIPSEVARRERFQKYFNCQGLINKQNIVTPIILLIQQIVCVAVVVGIYLHMFYISKSRMAKFSRMTAKRRKSLRRATTSVMLVAIVFIVTTIPFGITYQVRTLCDTGHIDKQLCAHITLNMRFGFGIVTHLGDLFAPMLFALFNPKIRKMLRYFVCAPCGVVPPTIESTSMGTSNHKSLEPDPEPASNEGSGSINEWPLTPVSKICILHPCCNFMMSITVIKDDYFYVTSRHAFITQYYDIVSAIYFIQNYMNSRDLWFSYAKLNPMTSIYLWRYY